MKVFVYGGSGLVSHYLIKELLDAGHSVVAGSRHPEKQQTQANLKWVQTEAFQPGAALQEIASCDAAFLLSPSGYTQQYEILKPFTDAAKSAGLKKLVLMTAMGVEFAPPEVPFRKLELEVIASGMPFAILRPNWFMQNFHTFWISGILKDRKIYFPGGSAAASFIDARDIAKSAFVALTDANVTGEFNLTGPAALTHSQVAEELSKATGQDITYQDISPEDFRSGLINAGLPEDYSDFLVMIAGALREGHAAPVLDTVAKLTGQAPRSFATYAQDHRQHWIK